MSSLITDAITTAASGTAAAWTSADTVLEAGEMGYETDTGKAKIGDGTTAWTSLDYSILPDISVKPTGTTDQLCKAWVNFDGTTNVGGFCTIRDSYNVASVTDNGTGDYTINFTSSMPNANYAAFGAGGRASANVGRYFSIHTISTSSIRVQISSSATSLNDADIVTVNIFST